MCPLNKRVFTQNLALICRFSSEMCFRRLAELVFVSLLRPRKLEIGCGPQVGHPWFRSSRALKSFERGVRLLKG